MSKSLAQIVAELPNEERDRVLKDFNPSELIHDWSFWGRPEQFAPPGTWNVWLILSGRGWGKTRTGAEWIKQKAENNPGIRIGLVGRTAADVRDVMINGDSGIMSLYAPGTGPDYKPSNRKITWPNGSTAMTYSGDVPDQLRGPQFEAVWADETAAWNHVPGADGASAVDNLRIATRLGSNPQILMTTTPKRVPFLRELVDTKDGSVVVTSGSTADNAGNLHSSYIERVYGLYAGTSLGAQELEGALMDAVEGALWKEEMIADHRLTTELRPPLIVVGVDPSVAENPRDECGIVVVGCTRERKLYNRQAYVLEDASVHGSPAVWSKAVIAAAQRWNAPVVAEVNQGGALVSMTLNALDATIPVYNVHSRVGKSLRAEPIAGAYEQGRVHHVNHFPLLEDQMVSWVPEETKKSPDRIDALVHGLTALLVAPPKDLRAALGLSRVTAHAARGSLDVKRAGLHSSQSRFM